MKSLELMEIDFDNLLSNGWRKNKDFYSYYIFNICVSLILLQSFKNTYQQMYKNRCPSITINEVPP